MIHGKGEIASKSLRLLILGGTGYIGPHHVRAAVERGHQVSVFNRGEGRAEFPPGVEQLVGDRNSDIDAIRNRDWDGIVDLAVYLPAWVRTLGEAVKDRVRHYTFISSILAYDNLSTGGIDETSEVVQYKGASDPFTLPPMPTQEEMKACSANQLRELSERYAAGPLKVMSEREAEKQFAGKTLIVRPGYIVGPRDHQEFFTYWPARLEQGGEVLAPGDPLAPVQFIDVRDLAEWVIRLVERGETGTYTASGPAMPLSVCEMLGGIRGTLSTPVKLTWVPLEWLSERKVEMWSSRVLYMPPDGSNAGTARMNVDKARAKGLTWRPLAVTAAETLAWHKTRSANRQASLISNMKREHEILKEWSAYQVKGA